MFHVAIILLTDSLLPSNDTCHGLFLFALDLIQFYTCHYCLPPFALLFYLTNSLLLANKRIWLLAWAQACLHFSVAVFWILWALTLVVWYKKF